MRVLGIALTAVLIVLSVAGIVGGFALLARRLIGIRFGLVRTLLAGAGLPAVRAAVPVAGREPRRRRDRDRALVPAPGDRRGAAGRDGLPRGRRGAGAHRLGAAAVRVAAERAAGRAGPAGTPRSPASPPGTGSAGRCAGAGAAAPTRSAGPRSPGRCAALDEGGVTFVKLGQLLSTRRDLLPAEFVAELGRLQDQAAPAPWPAVEAVLAAELGRPVARSSPRSTGSRWPPRRSPRCTPPGWRPASRWCSRCSGRASRPVVERDLDIVAPAGPHAGPTTSWGRSMGVRELAGGFAVALREELDFRVEAANMAAVAGRRRPGRRRIPRPHRALCTERLLVMERLDGVPLAAAGPADRRARAGPAGAGPHAAGRRCCGR